MANDDNHQYFITIPNSNGETIIITPEILPEQLLPLVQKKQFKEEKIDLSNFTTAYKKIIENLAENGSNSLNSISSLSNIINVNSGINSRIKQSSSNNENNKNQTNIVSSTSSSLITSRSSLPTLLLRPPNLNQSSQNLQSSIFSDQNRIPGSHSDNSNNYITTLQISQNNSTLAFSQPQTILHYSDQNDDSNTLLIPISLHNSNQFSQQQILVAAAAVASGGYNQNCNDSNNINSLTSNLTSRHNLNTTSLSKLISGNVTNPLTVNVSSVMRSSSVNSDISPSSKSSNTKRKSNINSTDEFGRRKEMRLLKNREAARECRRKKKEYVKCLENRVANLEQQNKVLVDEINRMKELYAKKISKKNTVSSLEDENKFAGTRSVDSYMKEDSYENMKKERESSVIKDKLYDCHPKLALTSMANIALSNISGNESTYLTKDILLHSTALINKDETNLFLLNDKEVSKSQLSALLANKSFKSVNYSSNSTIFPIFHHEMNPDDPDNSNSSCD